MLVLVEKGKLNLNKTVLQQCMHARKHENVFLFSLLRSYYELCEKRNNGAAKTRINGEGGKEMHTMKSDDARKSVQGANWWSGEFILKYSPFSSALLVSPTATHIRPSLSVRTETAALCAFWRAFECTQSDLGPCQIHALINARITLPFAGTFSRVFREKNGRFNGRERRYLSTNVSRKFTIAIAQLETAIFTTFAHKYPLDAC